MADCFLQHTVEAIARKMLDEAGSKQPLDLRELIGIHDPVSPRPVHIHEVDAAGRISRSYLGPAQQYRFSRRDPGNDPGIEAGPRVPDFSIRECSIDEYSHAARDDLVSRERAFG